MESTKQFERQLNKLIVASKKIIKDYSEPIGEILKKRNFSESTCLNDFSIDWKRIKAAFDHEKESGLRLAYDPDQDGFNFGFEKAV